MTDKIYLGILIIMIILVLFGDIKLVEGKNKTVKHIKRALGLKKNK
jgi:hypothetical protein